MKRQYEFKGGDNFDGIYEKYHHVMMRNELKNGSRAYELSWAGNKRSGPSFGGNQMDIAHNEHGLSTFLDIVKNARNNEGSTIIITFRGI
jgi:hypothetical protein